MRFWTIYAIGWETNKNDSTYDHDYPVCLLFIYQDCFRKFLRKNMNERIFEGKSGEKIIKISSRDLDINSIAR